MRARLYLVPAFQPFALNPIASHGVEKGGGVAKAQLQRVLAEAKVIIIFSTRTLKKVATLRGHSREASLRAKCVKQIRFV